MDQNEDRQNQINLLMTLRSKGILDKDVLNAMERTPRHLFVSEAFRDYAYRDMALPSSGGHTIPEPFIIAQICEALWLKRTHRVLVIGTGSGYLTAILAQMVRRVYTIELDRDIMIDAEGRFKALELHNIAPLVGDGWTGWQDQAPFDRIVITAAVDDLPISLYQQLQKDGIIIYPQIQENKSQQLISLRNFEASPEIKAICDVYFSILSKG